MNLAAGLVGVAFGALLFLSGLADYDVIHDGLLFRHAHLYLMMVATIGTAAPLLWVLRRRRPQTLYGGPMDVVRDVVERKHLLGGVIFGTGWGIAGTCPGAVAAMVASGKPWGLVVMAGLAMGVVARDLVEARAVVAVRSAPAA